MVDAYAKMKADSFKSQLQAALTTYYKDIKGVQGSSCCHKTRIVKHQLEDQEDNTCNEGTDAADTPAAAGAADAGASAANAGACAGAPGQPAAVRCLQLLHRPPALSGRQGHWVLRRRLLRLMPIELVCLNLNRCDTWQQPDPAYRPASRANKNQKDISVHTV
jgi:hypothetical protein